MKKLLQTRLHNPPESRGNCFPTVIACFMDLDSPEEVFQVQELYDIDEDWNWKIYNWLLERGWEWGGLNGHLYNDEYYLVSGVSPRNSSVNHACIYQNGKLWHDPHPDQTGVLSETGFEFLTKLDDTDKTT